MTLLNLAEAVAGEFGYCSRIFEEPLPTAESDCTIPEDSMFTQISQTWSRIFTGKLVEEVNAGGRDG